MEESIQENTVITLPNGTTFPRKVYSAYTVDELKEVIGCCRNYKEVLDLLKISKTYHYSLKKFVKDNTIDISHFSVAKPNTLENQLIKDSKGLSGVRLRKYLLKKKIVENKCSVCNCLPVWNNKPLTLQVDHINGNHFDNRIENLRLICPNCHSQTDTYTGRNVAKYEKKMCVVCNTKELKSNNISGKCAKCINQEKSVGKCSECNTNDRHRTYLKCKDCLKKPQERKKCKACNREIIKSTNTSDYHMRCHKGVDKNTETQVP